MQKCNYGALLAQWRCVVTSTSYYRCFVSLLFLRFFSFSFSYLSSSALVHLLFFLYSSTSFSLPHLTSLPLKNLLHPKHLANWREPIQPRKLLTEARLDLWLVGLSSSKLYNFFFFPFFFFFFLMFKNHTIKFIYYGPYN